MLRKTGLLLVLSAAAAWAQEGKDVVVRHPEDMDWKVSGTLPAGAAATHEYHLISEHPTTHGIEALVRFSRGYALPAHSHTHDEVILVLDGKVALGTGGKTVILKKGSYARIPAGTVHSLENVGWRRCEFLISFAGPVDFKGLYPAK